MEIEVGEIGAILWDTIELMRPAIANEVCATVSDSVSHGRWYSSVSSYSLTATVWNDFMKPALSAQPPRLDEARQGLLFMARVADTPAHERSVAAEVLHLQMYENMSQAHIEILRALDADLWGRVMRRIGPP